MIPFIRKTVFTVIFSTAVFFAAYAQTNVSGGIFANTTWTAANSPYIVTASVVVFPGYTLTIQPGVTVKFADGQVLEIRQAALVAAGTSAAPITFTSNSSSPTAGIYTGIYLNGGTVAPIFNFCNFSFADLAIHAVTTYPWAIRNSNLSMNNFGILSGSAVTVDSCVMRNNTDGMRSGGGTITHSRISQNGTGLDLLGTATVIDACVLDSNQTAVYGSIGSISNSNFKFNGTAIGWNNVLTVDNCHIISNGTGILVYANDTVKNCVIDSNTVAGIDNDGSHDPYHNWIHNNEISYNENGINETSGSPDVITKNLIENNVIGILVRLNTVYSSNTGCQNIYCNRICNNSAYGLKYLIPLNTICPSNYWCTSDSISTAALIYDAHDNVSSGIVNFMPLDTMQCYANPTGLNEQTLSVSYQLYPNPFSQTATLQFANPQNAKHDLFVYNDLGQLVITISNITGTQVKIDRGELPSGLYFFQLQENKEVVATGKFEVE